MTDAIGIRITLGANMGCKMSDAIGIRIIFMSVRWEVKNERSLNGPSDQDVGGVWNSD
jgi:hypothetical protein